MTQSIQVRLSVEMSEVHFLLAQLVQATPSARQQVLGLIQALGDDAWNAQADPQCGAVSGSMDCQVAVEPAAAVRGLCADLGIL